MISPTEDSHWIWGQPVLQGQCQVWKYLGGLVPMCSHCQDGMGEHCSQQAVVAFGIGGIVAAHMHWLLASVPCSQRLPWDSDPGWQVAACRPRGDPQGQFRNLFSRVKFDRKVKWKLWEVGSVFPAVVSQNHSR